MSKSERVLLGSSEVGEAIASLAREITEDGKNLANLSIIGIRRRGVPLAQRISAQIEKLYGAKPELGILDITLYRDDLSLIAVQPVVHATEINFNVEGKRIVLVDDVLFTGRTVRAAISEILDFGRPAKIELAVLVDRGHRELPIAADYVSKKIDTRSDELVDVLLTETDGQDKVVIRQKE
jgi:pyrimidine operon attenuation protein/uracil phosphoribosyltransferase